MSTAPTATPFFSIKTAGKPASNAAPKEVNFGGRQGVNIRSRLTRSGLKRLREVVMGGGGMLSIVLAGHPKLRNDLRPWRRSVTALSS